MRDTTKYETFQQAIAPWMPIFEKVFVSYIAVKVANQLVLCYMRATMYGAATGRPLSIFSHDSAGLACGSLELPFTSEWLEELRRSYADGRVQLADKQFVYALGQGQLPNHHVTEYAHHNLDRAARAFSVQVSGGNHMRNGDIDGDALSWEVRASIPPYDNVAELLDLMQIRRDVFSLSSPVIDIEALAPAHISEESEMKDGRTTIAIRASARIDPAKLVLTHKVVFKDKVERSTSVVKGLSWRQIDGASVGSISIPTGDGARMNVFLQYDGATIGHRWLRDPHKYANPLLAIYETFDDTSESLEKVFFKPKGDSTSFEAGVAMLLATLGLPASHYGASKLHDEAPDIVAPVPGLDVVLAIECTTDVLDRKDKLAKLISRSRALQDSLNSSNYEHIKVVPLIVSALPLDQLQAHISTARDNRVAVASKETLTAWLERRLQPLDQRALFDEIVGLIPRQYGGAFEQLEDELL